MYNFVAKNFLVPSLDLVRHTSTLKKLHELEQSQWWPRDKILELQSQRLKRLVRHAYDNVPYYRHTFDERSLLPHDIERAKDLARLPVLTKKLVRSNQENLVAAGFPLKERVRLCTSGSTGEPLTFYDTREDHITLSFAAEERAFSVTGFDIGDRLVYLSVRYQADPFFKNLMHQLIQRCRRVLTMYGRHIVEGDMPDYARKIERFKPALLIGCPSSIYPLARFLQREPKYKIKPRAIVTGSEQLFDYQRTLFQEVFNCEIYDRYGTEEQHVIAFECIKHSGYHIVAENTIVEVVDDQGRPVAEGEKGRILITNLHNFAQPFIRYDTGDIGVATEKSCPCGRGLPLLASLDGRSTDVIVTKSRGKISGNFLFYPAYPTFAHWGIEQYQIVQMDREKILIKIVPTRDFHKDTRQLKSLMAEAYQKILGEDMQIDLEIVDEIPVTAAGKRRFIISNIS